MKFRFQAIVLVTGIIIFANICVMISLFKSSHSSHNIPNMINTQVFNLKTVEKAVPKVQQFHLSSVLDSPKINTVNDFFDKIFILTLKEEPSRWLEIKYRLDMFNITAEKFYGVHFTSRFVQNHYKRYNAKGLSEYDKQKCKNIKCIKTIGGYAVLFSFRKLLNLAIKRNYQNILILEDDVFFHKDFHSIFADKIRYIPSDWKLLLLGVSQYLWHNNVHIKFLDNNMFYHPLITDGAFAVGISGKIFRLLIWNIDKFLYPFDSGPLRFIYTRYNSKCFVFCL